MIHMIRELTTVVTCSVKYNLKMDQQLRRMSLLVSGTKPGLNLIMDYVKVLHGSLKHITNINCFSQSLLLSECPPKVHKS